MLMLLNELIEKYVGAVSSPMIENESWLNWDYKGPRSMVKVKIENSQLVLMFTQGILVLNY